MRHVKIKAYLNLNLSSAHTVSFSLAIHGNCGERHAWGDLSGRPGDGRRGGASLPVNHYPHADKQPHSPTLPQVEARPLKMRLNRLEFNRASNRVYLFLTTPSYLLSNILPSSEQNEYRHFASTSQTHREIQPHLVQKTCNSKSTQ